MGGAARALYDGLGFRMIGRRHHYTTTRHTFQIYGICEDCRKKATTGRPV